VFVTTQTSDPAATTNTNLYTVPGNSTLRLHTLTACNRSSSAVTIRIGIDVGGNGTDTPSDAEWLYYDISIDANSTLWVDPAIGMLLAERDDLVVYASASDMSFVMTGELEYR
jgi:hypothetical protein